MPVPLAIALPAAAGALLYLDGRWRISSDIGTVRAAIKIRKLTDDLSVTGQFNHFYSLEALALDKHEKSKLCKTSTAEFIVFEGKTWTFKETYDIVLRYASWLHERYAIRAGEIVAMDFTNCPDFVFFWLAIWSLGAVPAFINYNLADKPLTHSVNVSSARVLVVEPGLDEAFTPEVRAGISSTEIVTFTDEIAGEARRIRPYRAPDSARMVNDRKDAAILIYTSGTTGLPKPAVVSWWKCYSGYIFITDWLAITPTDRFYTSMPLYHSSASILGLLTCLGAACPIILGRKFSVSNFWPEVRESRATIIQYVGETLRYLLSAPATALDTENNVRIAFGNGLRPDIWEAFKARFAIPTIAEFYAATESTNAFWNLSNNSFSAGAIGARGALAELLARNSFTIVEFDLVTEEPVRDPKTGLLIPVAPGQKGEMLFNLSDDPERKPRDRFVGYYNNERATESKLIYDVKEKGDTWFRTGDIMMHDADGRTYFSDRIGDTFRWKSENVSTSEVAEVLGRHPAIAEANVYGIQIPHHDGRAGCAAIVLRSDHPAQKALSDSFGGDRDDDNDSDPALSALLGSLSTHLSKALPTYAIPIFLRLMRDESEMQRTGNNKQQKHVLRMQGVDLDAIGSAASPATPEQNQCPKDRVFWLKGLQLGDNPTKPGGKRSGNRAITAKTGRGKGRAKGQARRNLGRYVRFRDRDWNALKEGEIRL